MLSASMCRLHRRGACSGATPRSARSRSATSELDPQVVAERLDDVELGAAHDPEVPAGGRPTSITSSLAASCRKRATTSSRRPSRCVDVREADGFFAVWSRLAQRLGDPRRRPALAGRVEVLTHR